METGKLAEFFMWCTILNGCLLIFSFLVLAPVRSAGDFVYRLHNRWFPMSRERFNAAIYLLVGFYKVMIFVFNLVPWLTLKIIH